MKNIVCPISEERIPEHLPRVTASLVITLFVTYILSGSNLVLIFLLYDFMVRGSNKAHLSLISIVAKKISFALNLRSEQIDKAPKLFAARLGGVLTGIALVMSLSGFQSIAIVISVMVAFFASLECVVNLCVGCYIYSWFVLPFYNKG